MDIVLKSA